MKKLNAFLVSVLSAAALNAAVIEQVIVRQQWPWSTDVKVEYKLKDVTCPVDIAIKAYNGDVELSLPEAAIKGDRYGVSDVVGTLVIDPVAAFGTAKVALANFKVKLTVTDSEQSMIEPLYMIFNLTTGEREDVSKADLLNGKKGAIETDYGKICSGCKPDLDEVLIWTAVTNDVAYKTTHLVMRRIKAKGKQWQMGSPATEQSHGELETLHTVELTNDYFIAIYPMTQGQYAKVGSGLGTRYQFTTIAEGSTADCVPAENTGLDLMRGDVGTYPWPAKVKKHAVDPESTVGRLRARTGVDFEFPTEAQWEFACRAGTTSALYNGKELYSAVGSEEITVLAWIHPGAGQQEHDVGLKLPNAFGLYDMLGGLNELCLDYRVAYDVSSEVAYEPEGADAEPGTARASRGGQLNCEGYQARCASRNQYANGLSGLRLVCPASLVYPADQK